MPLIALIIDLIAFGSYYLQLHNGQQIIYLLGLVFQVVITIGLLIMTFAYRGQRYVRWTEYGWHPATLRFGIIVFSLIGNAIFVFLYGLNYFGINDVIFSSSF